MTPPPSPLERFRRKPPTPLRRLPSARGRWLISLSHSPRLAIPARPSTPPPLVEARARAAKLLTHRRLLLDRPELHRHHAHRWTELKTEARRYVLTPLVNPPPLLAALAPAARRYVLSLAASLAVELDEQDGPRRLALERLRGFAHPSRRRPSRVGE